LTGFSRAGKIMLWPQLSRQGSFFRSGGRLWGGSAKAMEYGWIRGDLRGFPDGNILVDLETVTDCVH
jgi:hypothetical protein